MAGEEEPKKDLFAEIKAEGADMFDPDLVGQYVQAGVPWESFTLVFQVSAPMPSSAGHLVWMD